MLTIKSHFPIFSLERHRYRNENIAAHDHVRMCAERYRERKDELKRALKASTDEKTRFEISLKLDKHRDWGKTEEILSQTLVLNTETAMKKEVEALVRTVGDAVGERIYKSVIDVVRAVSTLRQSGNVGAGSVCNVEAVVEKCVMLATPKLLREQLGTQERAQRELERRMSTLDDTIQVSQLTNPLSVRCCVLMVGRGCAHTTGKGQDDLGLDKAVEAARRATPGQFERR